MVSATLLQNCWEMVFSGRKKSGSQCTEDDECELPAGPVDLYLPDQWLLSSIALRITQQGNVILVRET